MKRWLIVTLSVVAVLALIAGGAAWWLTRPSAAQPFTPALDQQAVDRNTAGVSALDAAGIHDAMVDVNATRVLVVFPADSASGNATQVEAMMKTALGAAAGVAHGAPKAYILSTVETQPHLAWVADLATFPDLVSGKITEEQYMASAVKVTSY